MAISTTQKPPASPPQDEAGGLRAGIRKRISDRLDTVKDAYAKTDGARGVAKSLLWRNRRQLLPFAVAAPVAVVGGGSAAAALSTHRPATVLLAALGAALLVAALGTVVARRYAPRIAEVGMTERVMAALVLAPAWCLLVPVIGPARPLTWLLLLGGTVVLSLRWWQRIRPGYVFAKEESPTGENVAGQSETYSPIQEIMDRWEHFVQRSTRALPGATLSDPMPTTLGADFQVQLVAGKQTVKMLRDAVDKIASGIGHFPGSLSFDDGPTPSQAVMHVRLRKTFEPVYEGPKIFQEGGDTWIGVGPYVDGRDVERYHLLSPDSVHSGFVLGSKGSGKSRLLESLAAGMRKLGVEIWWFDPQSGSSSPVLNEHADWSLTGMAAGDDPCGNVRKLLDAMQRVAVVRSMEQADAGQAGFTHTRERPAIMVIIDECHMPFGQVDEKTGRTFGEYFGNLDRILRKTGMGILGASQIFTLDTFGNSSALRSGLIAGNVLVLRMMERAHASLLPGSGIQPDEIPSGGGWGFGCGTDSVRPNIMWRAEANTDPAYWLRAFPRATLDPLSIKMAGDSYLDREEETEQSRARLKATLTRIRIAGTEEAARLLREFQGHYDKDDEGLERGARTGGPPTGPAWQQPDLDPPTLTERQAAVLAAFRGETCSVETLAERLETSTVTIRKYVSQLGESRLMKVSPGVYRPRDTGAGLPLDEDRDSGTDSGTPGGSESRRKTGTPTAGLPVENRRDSRCPASPRVAHGM